MKKLQKKNQIGANADGILQIKAVSRSPLQTALLAIDKVCLQLWKMHLMRCAPLALFKLYVNVVNRCLSAAGSAYCQTTTRRSLTKANNKIVALICCLVKRKSQLFVF